MKILVTGAAPYQVFNIGNSKPVKLMDFIAAIESAPGKPAEKIFMEMQPGDVPMTYADTTSLQQATGYQPNTDIVTGVNNTVECYKNYYHIP